MNDAVRQMMARHRLETSSDHVRALRDVLQELALLGLWRSKFYEHAAFYGGTALRVLHGLDRFSEDLDFSLLAPNPEFDLAPYLTAFETELRAFGFDVRAHQKLGAARRTAIHSAFLKAGTKRELVSIRTPDAITRTIHRDQVLTIKIEVDTDPPPGFETDVRYVLSPIPFAVRVYALPDLFAGKMHAVLCRRWKNRVKGRDWYDLVWFAARHPQLHLAHLEARMVQSGHWPADRALTADAWRALMADTIDTLNVDQARADVMPFVKDADALTLWSKAFFHDVIRRIELV
ncbi:MAG: nucleotidyl transferase AbiEii/AbiGii toxin family protein [Vicinamibacterales bacterium]|nr:nucleotidyl transferase AbiEii/AbiGii toxin family protein [Vicinamibacterales bacterium]